ncbi:MAG: type II toxin-antitoxin system VapC family toxin [Bacteroidetes bacterium]|nr:type II toxin-antitoxin system VapC family toxin [Bacteroidota bacterium]
MRYILDTNTLIYFMDGTLTPKGFEFVLNALENEECALSVISKIEVLGFPFPDVSQEQKAGKFVHSLPIFQLTEDVVEKSIEIRKARKTKIADAIIAATAILKSMTLISRNEKDFKNLPGLNFINPFEL